MSSSPTTTALSCSGCPNYVRADEVPSRTSIGFTFGSDVDYCAARGIPLNRPGVTPPERAETLAVWAASCPSHNKPERFTKTAIAAEVAVQTVTINTRTQLGMTDGDRPENCRDCIHFIEPHIVRKKLGWTTSMCGASGKTLPQKRLRAEPKGCAHGVDRHKHPVNSGHASNLVQGLMLPPVYGAVIVVDENSPARATRNALPDPNEYVSDLPVDPEDAAIGIRAWRAIRHPKHPARFEVRYLPIFDPDSFDEESRRLIPQTGDDKHPELYNDHKGVVYAAAVSWQGLKRSPLLIGPSGTGKTDAQRHIAWLCQMPFVRIACNNEMTLDGLAGKHLVDAEVDANGGKVSVTTWVDGELTRWLQKVCILCVDEVNMAPGPVSEFIRPLLDEGKLVLGMDRNQEVPQHDFCCLGFTANPAWDPRYAGTREMSEADGQRLTSLEVDFPDEETERDIIINWCNAEGYGISYKTLDAIMKIGQELRALSDPMTGVLPIAWGVRVQITAALCTRYFTFTEAYRVAVADRLDPDQRKLILDVVKQITDED